MKQTIITTKSGKKLVVREPKESDLSELLRYINTLIAEDTFILMSGKPITRQEEATWLRGVLKNIEKKEAVYLLVFDGKKLVANASVVRQQRRLSHIGLFGITVAIEYRGDGLGKQLMNLALEQAKEIGVQMVILEVFGNNDVGCSLYQKLGFERYGVLPKALVFHDLLIDLHQMYKRL